MRKLLLIAGHEYRKFTRRKSFILGTMALPLIIVVLVGVGILIAVSRDTSDQVIGYVDEAGLVASAADEAHDGAGIVAFSDLDTALTSLDAGDVAVVYVVTPEYRQTGGLSAYYLAKPPPTDVSNRFAGFLRTNLALELPPDVRARALEGPKDIVVQSPDGSVTEERSLLGMIIPFALGLFFMFAVMSAAGYLLQAVTDEKETRSVEVLTTSVTPEQLVGGKAVGLIGLALTQVAVWIAFAAPALIVAGHYLEPLRNIEVSGSFLALAAVFFLPSFVLAAGIITIIGAAVPDFRQGQQISGMVNIFFLLPLFFVALLFSDPNNPFLIVLSLFPTTSFLTLTFRWGATTIPHWQIATAFALLVLSAIGSIWVAPRVFRLGMLSYGRRLSFRTVVQAFGPSPRARRAGEE